jgi:PAS domain S-box-containing protein
MTGMNYKDYMTEANAKRTKNVFNTVYNTENVERSFQYELFRKDGKAIYGESSIYLRYDSNGEKIGFSGFLRDVTEKRDAEIKLKESEEKYRNMIEDLDLGFYQIKWDGTVLNVNPSFCEIMGFDDPSKVDDITTIKFWKSHEDTKKFIKELLKYEAVEDYIGIGNNILGEELVLQIHSHLIRDNEGKPFRIEGTIADITEKFKLEQKLKESEERYRFLFENSPLAIILSDSNGIIRDTNPATENLIGYKKSEIIGRAFMNLSLVHEDYLPDIMERFKQQIMGNVQPPYDVEFYHKDGNLLWANIISTPIRIGNEAFLQVIAHDITERKKAELLIKEEIEKLKELDQIRKDLISRVSHELKTPLIPVMGGAELLLYSYKDQLEKEPLEIIELIEKGGKRLAKLVERLLDITKIEYDKFKLDIQKIDLSEIINDAVKYMKYLIEKREIDLYVVVPDDLYLEVDGFRIEQVVTNLLSNAIKNTPPKGRISVMLEKYTSWAIISISDTGVGFTDEEMKKIFSRFGKIERYGDGLEYIDMGGSGLGLYISKRIVDLHGGKIWVESTGRNRGCIFKVRLPIK